MSLFLWLTNIVAYRMIRNLRWEVEIMDLADKVKENRE